jgi:death-on-curing protein
MDEPKWIRLELALAAHERQLAQHGGISGVRDRGLLQSALMRPRNLFAYTTDADLAKLAASYAGGIVRNHPFLDGNKRTALVVCRTFLFINGYQLVASQAEKAQQVLKLAASEIAEDEFAEWIRSRLKPRA